MEHQDWTTITFKKRVDYKGDTQKVARTQLPPGATKFKQLDSDEPPPPAECSLSVRMQMQKARVSKRWSQKDLAKALCVHASVINDYESGKVAPDKQTLAKISRALGVKIT